MESFTTVKEYNTNFINLVNEIVMIWLTKFRRKGKREQK